MALLGCTDVDKMSRTLLAMSSSPANCDMMRASRCVPLLVQLLHLDKPEQAPARRRTRVQELATLDLEMESLGGREGGGVRGATVLT